MRARGILQRPSGSIAPIEIAFLIVLGILGVSGRRAQAQSAEAEALFNDGDRLMAERKLAEACQAFDASNRAEPRAGTLIRLGECREQNEQLASAWSAYKDALTRVKDPRKRSLATARAAALESRLSTLIVSVSDDSRVEGLTLVRNGKPLDSLLWNRALPIDGGDYVIAARAAGHEDWQTTAHVPIEGGKVRVEVPALKELVVSTPSTPVVTPRQAASRVPTPSPAADRLTTRRKLAIGLASVGVIGAVTGAVLGTSATGRQDDAYRLCADPAKACSHADEAQILIKAGQRRALEANLAFGVAITAVIGAGVLWLTGAPDAEHAGRVTVVPSLGPRQAGIVATGWF